MTDNANENQTEKRSYTRRRSYFSYGNGKPYHAFSVLFYDPKELELVKNESAESLDAEEDELAQELSGASEENKSADTADGSASDEGYRNKKVQDTDFQKLKAIFDSSPLKKSIKDLGVLN